MHLHGDKKRKWYEAYFFLYVRIVCNILYIYYIPSSSAFNERTRKDRNLLMLVEYDIILCY